MAKKLKAETLALDVVVNANNAQKNINDLGRTITDTNFKIKELKNQQLELVKAGQKNSAEYKSLGKEITSQQSKIKSLKEEQDKLINSLSLEQKTIAQLKKQLSDLNRMRNNSIPGSEQYNAYGKQIDSVTNRLQYLQNGAERTGNVLTKMSGNLSQYIGGLVAGGASLIAFWTGSTKAIQEYAAFDDNLADVMKTTDLTKESVKELNSELTKIETRTSQEDLLGLSRIAGKLGYSEVGDITEFVKANNQIIVALNEDLGGNVEETVNHIGKLVDIFKLKDLYGTEDAFLKVGSAINELGMASTANEGYMVEFARRMSGVAPLAKISIDQILGLGAALDQLGQTEEVSSTALNKLFVNMASDAETYSKYAGMKLTDFKKLLENDFMGAFTKVLSGVKDNANGINELAATLGDLGEDGGRVIGVLGSLANNVDVLKSSMNLANQAMVEGDSITKEYNIKNETAAAKLDMAKKRVKDLWIELGEKLWPAMTTGLSLFGMFINILKTSVNFISNNFRVISSLTIAIIAYYTAMQIAAKWTAINTGLMVAKEIILKSAVIAYRLLTGQITRTAAAQQLLNLRMLANPYGLVAAALVGLISYLVIGSNKIDKYTESQKKLNQVNIDAKAETELETSAIKENLKEIQNSKNSIDEKRKAIENLRKIMPDVLKDYTDEQILAGEATTAIKNHAKAILLRAEARMEEELLKEELRRKADNEKRLNSGFEGLPFLDKAGYYVKGLIGLGRPMEMFLNDFQKIERETNGVIDLYKNNLKKKYVEIEQLQNQYKIDLNPTGNRVENEGSNSAKKTAYQKELDEAEKHHQKLLQQKGLFREDLSELDKEQLIELAGYQKTYQDKLDAINTKYGESLKTVTQTANQELKKRADAESNYINSVLIKRQSESEAEKAAYDDRLKKAGLFGVERESLTARQLLALEILEKEHKDNLAKIDANAIAKEIDSRINNNRDVVSDLRIRHQEELSSIRNLSQAKDYLRKYLNGQELAQIRNLNQARRMIQNQQMLEEQNLLKNQLNELITILSQAQSSGEFEGLVLSDKILSDEEKQIILDRLRTVKEELGKLTGQDKSDELSNDENSRLKVDVLGMSVQDWENLFNNIGTSREKIQGVLGVLGAATQIWGQYNAMVAAKENAQLQKDEQVNNKKKDNLKRRLDEGLISQEDYNKHVEALDKEMERKKAIVARDQAKRERNVALMSAIVNTARGITAAFPNPILMAIIAAMGALQIGTISATPLPEIPGAESGGRMIDVVRSQDGKRFNAKSDPNKRGYVSNPTVIIGENGKEWVANANAVSNPAIAPLFDVLDKAQRDGTIDTMTISEIIARTLPNRVQGRASGGSLDGGRPILSTNQESHSMEIFLLKNMETMEKLSNKIDEMEVKVGLLGKDGFLSKMDELKNLEENGNF
ncbi:phage tail tape measure protein [Sphingobacterium kyonggiense]|uniref:Phage tail tape measure protein n=1 Tax=Sphingobacterium kyonggiense TaxID=714075 RepID=A0ABP7YLN4_9SPHI